MRVGDRSFTYLNKKNSNFVHELRLKGPHIYDFPFKGIGCTTGLLFNLFFNIFKLFMNLKKKY